MKRRRHQTPKVPPQAASGRVRSPQTRRRAREDAQVPAELRIGARKREEVKVPPAQKKQEKRGGVVLVTGFEPFDGDRVNASWEACGQLAREIAGLRVETLRVPVEFRRAIEVVAQAIERHRPALVIGLGQASGRTHLGVERVAINLDDARIPDNAGARPIDEPIAANGPAAYLATVPVKAMVRAMREAGAPAYVSNSAGTFVCNHLMYGVLHYLAASGIAARAGFIHVPAVESQAMDKPALPTMSAATMARGIEAAIAAAHSTTHDIESAEGALD
jgi:pyroglutamyl-peptidase